MNNRAMFRALCLVSAGGATLSAHSALAQSQDGAVSSLQAPVAEQATEDGDIIVTARRRDETSISVPVAITAIGGAELERRGINTVDALSRAVPTLITSEATSSPQGGIVAIRGLSGVDANPFGDQAVSFNVDGVPVARSSVRRLGQMDVGQIEVLKGPQALFFGKNSPAGIIVIRSADPTPDFSGSLSAGYEFNADQFRTEGYVSVPLGDTLGFRLAGFYDTMKGYVDNIVPASGAGVYAPFDRRGPNGDEFGVRGTLKWDPSDRFDLRLKVSYGKMDGSGSTDNLQHVSCPLPVPQTSFAPENCIADGVTTSTDNIGPNFGQFDPRFGNGETYLKSSQWLAGLEMNYHLNDELTLSSITGYYKARNSYVGNFLGNFTETGVAPRTFLVAYAGLDIEEFSQELRLTTDFAGPVNFMFGGFLQKSEADVDAVVSFNADNPQFRSDYYYRQKGSAHSIFGQAQVDLSETLELAVGARYSYERKRLPNFTTATGANRTQVEVDIPRSVSFNNLSPEATLTWRPTRSLTIYGAYKEGFLSGGFNATAPIVGGINPANGRYVSATDPRYDQQIIRGFEAGVKASLFDGSLRANLTLYDYDTTGLQVAVLIDTQQELRNAGEARTRGVEFDFNWRTPVDGLAINGAVAYLDGEYRDYQAPCYRGLPAPQCVVQINRFTGRPGLLHDLSGTELVRSPDIMANIGFDYVSPEISGFKLGLGANLNHSDSFFTDVVSAPGGRQKSYQLVDATARVMDADERWELALIGRNLTNEYYFSRSADNPFTGSAPGGAGTLLGDTVAVPSRGREIMLKATVRF